MKKEKKLIKVTFEYDNGEIRSLEGEEARDWAKEVNSYVGIMSMRRGTSGLKHRPWKIINKNRVE